MTMQEILNATIESRGREIEAAIHGFRECGVEIERFSLEEHPNLVTKLCIDGVPRFTWQAVVR